MIDVVCQGLFKRSDFHIDYYVPSL